jgi:FkbM family methyltransferase
MRSFGEEFEKIRGEISNDSICVAIREAYERTKAADICRPLVLYGAGILGKGMLDICRELSICVSCFCDRAVQGTLDGVAIVTPEALQSTMPDAIVFVCSITYNQEICDTLLRFGFPAEAIIPFPSMNPFFRSYDGFLPHFAGYEWAYDLFVDDRSKQTVLDKIRLILCDRSLNPNTNSDCYYEEGLISLLDGEVYIDGGAFNGGTVVRFIKKMVPHKDYQVHAFEPSKRSFSIAANRLTPFQNVHLIQKGLWSFETEIAFFENVDHLDGSSFVLCPNSSGGENHIPVTSLDAYFKGSADSDMPTFVKLDVEGAEKEALIGASEVISRHKPKLAICAYHKLEDIYELPQTILRIRDDYRLALRQHESGYYGIVLYAV